MWLVVSIIEIVIGIAVIVIARVCRFDEKFYYLREAYLKLINARFKSYGEMLRKIDEKSQSRFTFLRKIDRRLGQLMLWIFYLLGLGIALLGVRVVITGRYDLLDIFFILTIPAITPLYLFAEKLRDRADSKERQA